MIPFPPSRVFSPGSTAVPWHRNATIMVSKLFFCWNKTPQLTSISFQGTKMVKGINSQIPDSNLESLAEPEIVPTSWTCQTFCEERIFLVFSSDLVHLRLRLLQSPVAGQVGGRGRSSPLGVGIWSRPGGRGCTAKVIRIVLFFSYTFVCISY